MELNDTIEHLLRDKGSDIWRVSANTLVYDAIALINSSRKPVLAIDIPSGLDSDRGKALGIAVRAKMTGTLAVAKRGLVIGNGPYYAGKIKVIDISIPRKLISMYTT